MRDCSSCAHFSPLPTIAPGYGTCAAEAPFTAEQARLEAQVWPRSVQLKRSIVAANLTGCPVWRARPKAFGAIDLGAS